MIPGLTLIVGLIGKRDFATNLVYTFMTCLEGKTHKEPFLLQVSHVYFGGFGGCHTHPKQIHISHVTNLFFLYVFMYMTVVLIYTLWFTHVFVRFCLYALKYKHGVSIWVFMYAFLQCVREVSLWVFIYASLQCVMFPYGYLCTIFYNVCLCDVSICVCLCTFLCNVCLYDVSISV